MVDGSDGGGAQFRAEIVPGIEHVDATDWNRVAGDENPFVRHEFLYAMERSGCACDATGWSPHHVVLYRGEELLGAVPMYAKSHSYGEFVFDWGWADAYSRAGLEYYPKLVVGVPFTPAAGPRLLFDRAGADESVPDMLAAAAVEFTRRVELSSLHWLFTLEDDTAVLSRHDHLLREGCQFHWSNPGYRDFQDYLDGLTSKRRKAIKRERREAARAPVDIEVLHGKDVTEDQWRAYHRLYSSTYDRKFGYPSLTEAFFMEIGETMGACALLILARRAGRYVAGAHLFRGARVLFGRNWGCSEFHRSLHFEMCYYRAIEYCIEHRLTGFEAGAQGEHKITRGFMPVKTWSAHWVRHDAFRDAIGEFVTRERRGIDGYIDEMESHSPFHAGFDSRA